MLPEKKLFGTDGVRGVANVEPVTAETALKLGRAAAHVFTQLNPRTHPAGVAAQDRARQRHAAFRLHAGECACRRNHFVRRRCAPHRPAADAGRGLHHAFAARRCRHRSLRFAQSLRRQRHKIFPARWLQARRQDRATDRAAGFHRRDRSVRPTAGKIGRATRIDDALGRYVEFAKASFPRGMSLEKMRIAVDVANGAGYKSTPCILRELGAELTIAHNEPNGTNINAECGSTFPAEIQRLVKESGAQIGIANDGDADRVLLADENGELVDGDEILAIASVDLLQSGKLRQDTLVATVMSNFGLDEALGCAWGQGDPHESRRSLRDRGDGGARSESRRRTKRAHDFSRFHDDGRRHHQRTANSCGS